MMHRLFLLPCNWLYLRAAVMHADHLNECAVCHLHLEQFGLLCLLEERYKRRAEKWRRIAHNETRNNVA